jgi:YHS domain-containing protein
MKRTILALILIAVFATVSMTAFAQAKNEKTEKVKDPVCGIMVEKNPDLSATYKGETYYFCSRADMDKFKKTPEKYAPKK